MQTAERPPRDELGFARTRVEDPRLVTGQGRYVEDINLPGTLSLAFVRSPYPRARIVSVDAEAARSAPGVVAGYTGQDVAQIHPLPILPIVPHLNKPPYQPLAIDEARHVGQPVAMVAAQTRAQAVDAAALIDVEH